MTNVRRLDLRISGSWLATLCFALVTLALLDGALQQAQMIATGGHVLIPPVTVKLMICLVLVIATSWQLRWRTPAAFTVLWLLTILYLVLDAIFLLAHLHVSFADIAFGYNSYYAYFLIAPLVAYLQDEVSERRAIVILLVVFALCFVVGSLQYVTQRPILYTESIDGSFVALSWNSVDDGLRAFSLFTSGLSYGSFSCFVGAIGAGLFLRTKHRKFATLVFVCAGFACYSTMTRNCYVQFAFASISAVLLASRGLRRYVRYLPILFLLLSIVIAWRAVAADSSSDSAITSNVSVLIRAVEWQYYLALYAAAPLVEKLFGLGIIQNANATSDALVAVDNQYLGILMNVGLVGIMLMGWLQWKMWIRLYCRAVENPSFFRIACAAFWSTFLSVYFYNVSIAPFCLIFVIALLVKSEESTGGVRSLSEDRGKLVAQ